jgi:hypothetical protein
LGGAGSARDQVQRPHCSDWPCWGGTRRSTTRSTPPTATSIFPAKKKFVLLQI